MARCLAANKLPLILARSKRLYRFKVFLDPRRACLNSSLSAGGEAEEDFMFSFFPFCFFGGLVPTFNLPLHPARRIASGHLTST